MTRISKPMIVRVISTQAATATASAIRKPRCRRVPSRMIGTIEVSGPIGQIIPTISPGYGFTAIIVAFLGRLHPLGIIPAGLLVALSYIGGENAQVEVGVPQGVTGLFQGLLLFFLLASDFLVRYRVSFTSPRREVAPA